MVWSIPLWSRPRRGREETLHLTVACCDRHAGRCRWPAAARHDASHSSSKLKKHRDHQAASVRRRMATRAQGKDPCGGRAGAWATVGDWQRGRRWMCWRLHLIKSVAESTLLWRCIATASVFGSARCKNYSRSPVVSLAIAKSRRCCRIFHLCPPLTQREA